MEEFCREIGMPEAVTEKILTVLAQQDSGPELHKLMSEDTWSDGLRELRSQLGEDPDGYGMLCCMLRCAMRAWDTYRTMGISRRVYRDTMACFSRFVREHLESYGRYGFDRGFWTVRQVSCRLFRIGKLEYELPSRDGIPAIHLHIPSDACLDHACLLDSFFQARALLERLGYGQTPVRCRSWLLSPTLKQLLPADSRILEFQRFFELTALGPGDSYKLWVFKDPRLELKDYPETTSLQRELKAFLLNGGAFLEAEGTLRRGALREARGASLP